jgi:hypothetical protein
MIQLLSSGGAGAAVIVVTVVFLRYLKGEREELMADRREERQEFLQKLEQISRAITDLTTALWERPCLREAEKRLHTQRTGGASE